MVSVESVRGGTEHRECGVQFDSLSFCSDSTGNRIDELVVGDTVVAPPNTL